MDKQQRTRDFLRAVKNGDVERIAGLLKADDSLVGIRESDGSTPLHAAAWKGQAEVARLLLDSGADVNAQSKNTHYGTTPLHAAAHGNQKRVAEVLIAFGADLSARNLHGRTPLQETKIHNATAVARLLRGKGATV